MNCKITSTVIGTLLLAAASVLNAQDKQTLDLLVSKGIITKEEAASVAKKSVAVAPKEKTTKSIKLIGRLQMQYENINTDETVNGVESSLTAKNDFIMRRMSTIGARLPTSARAGRRNLSPTLRATMRATSTRLSFPRKSIGTRFRAS